MIRRAAPWIVVAAAAAALLVPLDPVVVERWYSTRAYPLWQPAVTRSSNAVPFALFDLLLVAVCATLLAVIVAAARGFRQGRRMRALLTALGRVLIVGAVLYLWFVAAWGLNYRRVPLLERLELSTGPPSAAAVEALGRRTVEQLDALHDRAHALGWPDPWRDAGLRRAYQQTQRALADVSLAVPGRLKSSLIGPYFRWASVDGMIDPFALEVIANPDLLPFERPFVAGHEWAHLAGYADESEASFVGFLTCLGAGPSEQYSAWLFLYWEIVGAVGPAERKVLDRALGPGPRADATAVAERLRRGQLPRLRAVSWAAYDEYLKANHVAAGVRSYDEVITLLTRARFTNGWEPIRRREGEGPQP